MSASKTSIERQEKKYLTINLDWQDILIKSFIPILSAIVVISCSYQSLTEQVKQLKETANKLQEDLQQKAQEIQALQEKYNALSTQVTLYSQFSAHTSTLNKLSNARKKMNITMPQKAALLATKQKQTPLIETLLSNTSSYTPAISLNLDTRLSTKMQQELERLSQQVKQSSGNREDIEETPPQPEQIALSKVEPDTESEAERYFRWGRQLEEVIENQKVSYAEPPAKAEPHYYERSVSHRFSETVRGYW